MSIREEAIDVAVQEIISAIEIPKERDLIAIEIKDSNDINRTIYNNIDLIIDLCNRIPELYINSSLDNKRIMLRMLIEEILYNHIDTILEVKLKPIFEALRRIKDSYGENVRTLKTPIIPNKKAPEGAIFKNGADSGIRTHVYRNHNPRS